MIIAQRPLSRVTAINPLTILGASSVVAWHRSDTVTLVSGNVSVWDDLSGNGNDLAATGSTYRPLLASGAAPSGADAVRLVKSVPRYLRCTTYGGVSEDYTIILVAKWTYAAAPEYIVAPPSTYSCPYLRNIPPSSAPLYMTSSSGFNGPSWTNATWYVYEATIRGVGARLSLNNGTPTTGNLSGGTMSLTGLNLGGDPSYAVDADLTEIVIVNRELTTAERTAINTYTRNYAGF